MSRIPPTIDSLDRIVGDGLIVTGLSAGARQGLRLYTPNGLLGSFEDARSAWAAVDAVDLAEAGTRTASGFGRMAA